MTGGRSLAPDHHGDLADLGANFSVDAARAAGVSPSRLRRGDLERPFHGVRSVRARRVADESDRLGHLRGEAERAHIERALRYAPRMSDAEAFSHATAAVLWDLPLPQTVVADPAVHVAVAAPHRLPRSRGVRGHQVVREAVRTTTEPRSGLRVTDPATTWAMLASVLPDPYDLVAVGDAAVRTWRVPAALTTIDELRATLQRGRRVGNPMLRECLPRVRTGSASRPETHLRLLLIDAGLPEPTLNHDVWIGGERIAAVDLSYPRRRVAIEYEGEHHLRSPVQWARDIERYRRLRAHGWIVIQVTKTDLRSRSRAVVEQVRAAL